jgi:hypothetical protein
MRYLAVTFMLASLSPAVAQMTHEETMVRTAYAKFAYSVQQGVIGRLAVEADNRGVPKREPSLTSDQRLAAAQVDFTLSDFVIGDVRDIVNRKAVDLISPASGEMLDTSGESGANYSDQGLATRWQSFELHWKPAHPLPAAAQTITISEWYALQWREQWPSALWQRYASYSVKVIYQGKTVGPYKALFLFGRNAQGDEEIAPMDGTTNAASLGTALTLHLFPDAFVLTRLRNIPVVASWLNANQMLDASCPAGKADVCCDLTKLKCGPGHVDLVNALSRPLPGE